MTTKTTWPQADYERAMTYKGRVSSGVAARITGIPRETIKGWWRGTRPKHLFVEAQRAGVYAPPPGNTKPKSSRARAAKLNREASKRDYYRRRCEQFHPLYNPDPLLAPFERLWLPAGEVVPFIQGRLGDVASNQFGGKDTVGYKRWYEMTTGRRAWLRYDTADALFCTLGLVLSEMSVEPVYSAQSPAFDEIKDAA